MVAYEDFFVEPEDAFWTDPAYAGQVIRAMQRLSEPSRDIILGVHSAVGSEGCRPLRPVADQLDIPIDEAAGEKRKAMRELLALVAEEARGNATVHVLDVARNQSTPQSSVGKPAYE